jgi:hypothetical protein
LLLVPLLTQTQQRAHDHFLRAAMAEFEYEKIDLNNIARKGDDIDLLDDLGEQGWELVVITANNIAYLKREVGSAKKRRARSPSTTPASAVSGR